MKCPKCQFENREEVKFCEECGVELEFPCPKCGADLPSGRKFCGKCGQKLGEALEAKEPVLETQGERKHVTALFSDLSGYTALTEKMDPEEVKEIMSRLFGEIAQVVTKYGGFVEKFVGDAVLALFGVPTAHEDDPIRAIRAAKEIHEVVEAISPQVRERTSESLSMHTGINTGLVVTGKVDLDKGTHGVAGDTLNLASRLSGMAKPGDILVGPETYRQTEGYFTFESFEPTPVKGKAGLIPVYKVLSAKERPITVHRPSGLRADLIGRKAEMAQLEEAVQRLREGKGTILSICGDPGSGKSRLVAEFKATLDLKQMQWLEGHSYAYSQNIPYFPLIDLLNRAWQIEEGDPPQEVRKKVESEVELLMGKKGDIAPYIGSLYALHYPGIEGVSPDFWKSRLQEAVQTIVSALTRRAATILCMEDLQWADPSSLDLLRFLLSGFGYPALFLCVCRLPFSLFTSHQLSGMGKSYQEIRLQDLSPSDTQDMMESLLKSKALPPELRRFVQEKVEGNPFYLEEMMNSLIESGTLARDNGNWRLSRPLGEANIPPTVQGVISARIDRLEKEMKRILQEASVIGRAFLYEILRKITELKESLDRYLHGLEQLDLIRVRSFQPELEYLFKHALTQEVVYNGLLKKERQAVHERIALVMEQLFQDRLPELYETLAFHFRQGVSMHKAVEYLMKSGEKSLGRYALEESHQYYQQAFDLLAKKRDKTKEDERALIDLVLKWAWVFYCRGDFAGLVKMLSDHERLAEALNDKTRLGMLYAWLGMGLWGGGKAKDAYEYLCKALKVGEEIENPQVIGYACAWLTWTCTELGLLEEAEAFGKRAQEISMSFESDPYLYFKSLSGLGCVYHLTGEVKKAIEVGKVIVDYGQRHSNIRSLVMGHLTMGYGYGAGGNFPSAIECLERAIQISADPFYTEIPKTLLSVYYVLASRFVEAETALQEVLTYSQKFGAGMLETPASIFLGVVLIAKGQMSQGFQLLEKGRRDCLKNQRRAIYALSENVLGKVYLQMVERSAPISLSIMAKNIGFLIKNVPFAAKKAEEHFNKALQVAREIGAKSTMGMVLLDLGLLHRAKGRKDKAREYISSAIQLFEQCEAEGYLKQAKEALETLG